MTKLEVQTIFYNVDENKDGKLDYEEVLVCCHVVDDHIRCCLNEVQYLMLIINLVVLQCSRGAWVVLTMDKRPTTSSINWVSFPVVTASCGWGLLLGFALL